jgi:hypothetical protein
LYHSRYSTFCALAGISHLDDPPVKPLPVDPSNPGLDIYGTDSWPSVDGVNLWPMLTTSAYGGAYVHLDIDGFSGSVFLSVGAGVSS